jgi:hypothetical protein
MVPEVFGAHGSSVGDVFASRSAEGLVKATLTAQDNFNKTGKNGVMVSACVDRAWTCFYNKIFCCFPRCAGRL